MRKLPPTFFRRVHHLDFFEWCLTVCFASLAMTTSAQSQVPSANPGQDAPVTIPPQTEPAPPVFQSQPPPPGSWDRFWQIQRVTDDDDWTRHFRIGAIVGFNIKADFNLKKAITFSNQGLAQGNYDDGYVHPSGQGWTSNWGYNNGGSGGQYDSTGNTLAMHHASSFTTDASSTITSSQDSDSVFPGFEAAYGGNIWDWDSAKIGWDFGFSLMPMSFKDNVSLSNGTLNQDTYIFDTHYIPSSLFPGPGYRGGPNGGPLISDTSHSGTPVSTTADLTGWRKINVMFYTFRLGPTVYWDLSENTGLMLGAGPAVGLACGNLQYNEQITGASSEPTTYKGQIDSTDFVYGGYANAMLTYEIEKNGDLYIGAQYMSMGDASFGGGGREGKLNLGGQIYITAGINWPF